jgi:hypothetical protein
MKTTLSQYFSSNESDVVRKLSKGLTLLIAVLTPLLVSNLLTGKTLHDITMVVNIAAVLVKVLLPLSGNDTNQIPTTPAEKECIAETPKP